MTVARRKQLCLEVTPYYHCISRCVRHAYLCGKDRITNKDFNHRRGWIEKRLLLLSEVFCIDVAGYAIMSNHFHVVLMVNQTRLDALSDKEVVVHWRKIYKGPEVIQRYLDDETLSKTDIQQVRETVSLWRNHMTNISRFMGNLNQTIARWANKEDDCKGRFWEGRFKMQALLDTPALLAALCYVDLNPVRAKIAKTPENSKYTSVYRRLRKRKTGLMSFRAETPKAQGDATDCKIPVSFKVYLELLDYTGRAIRKGKRGSISADAAPIMSRLGYTPEQWMKTQTPRHSWLQKAVGKTETIKQYCEAIGQQWIWQG